MKMLIPLCLLFLFIDSTSAKKEGDFGIFTACTYKNNSLRLICQYANCSKSPSFGCEFMTPNGSLLARASNENCWYILPNHRLRHGNKTTNYNCTLIRKMRKEDMQITVDYSIHHGRKRIRPCRGTTSLPPHPAPALLWPVVTVCLWRLLITDDTKDWL